MYRPTHGVALAVRATTSAALVLFLTVVPLVHPVHAQPPEDVPAAEPVAPEVPEEPTVTPDPNAAPVDPNAVPVDPNAAPVDPNAVTVDPNAAPVDPNAVPVVAPVEMPTLKLELGADTNTGLKGRVVDSRTGQPIGFAPVIGRGSDGKARTSMADEQGNYTLYVPPGTYVVRSYFDLYHGARFDRVRVVRGAFAPINLVLDPLDMNDDVVVQEIEIPYRADTTTAAAQDQLRKESSGIGEGMGAQQMSQQGASDAAAAAKRVVGVTIDDSQLLVRGLGGRYVKVYLNGLPIPNTDPDFPSVDLDLFPTNVIDSLNVQKVFLPDIPAEFAGGTLDLTTVSFPRQFILEASVGTAFNSQTTFRDRLDHKGGRYDFLGYDDGSRSLPSVLDGKPLSRKGFPTIDEQAAAAEQFPNRWNYSNSTLGLPKMGGDFTIGDSIKFGNRKRFGYLASLVYDYEVERKTGIINPRPGFNETTGELQVQSNYRVESASENVQIAAIGTASLDLGPDHSITALTMFNRSMEDKTRVRNGFDFSINQNVPVEKWQLSFLAREVWVNQLLGDHRNLLGTRMRLRWSTFYSLGKRDEPDQRNMTYGDSNGVIGFRAGDRFFSALSQTDAGAATSLRIPLWDQATMTLGGRLNRSDRDFGNRRFDMIPLQLGDDASVLMNDPEFLFNTQNLGTLTLIRENTRLNDSYRAKVRAYDAFALLETPLWGPLSAAGGARMEIFKQEVQSFSPFPEDNTPENLAMFRAENDTFNILPGAALKYTISDTMLLRAGYGQTLSRPQVRELAPYAYYDFLRDRQVKGNPELKSASIQNLDLRWEWFFGEGQIVAVSGFYKKFENPIELQIIIPETQDSEYQNAKGATNYGGEFEFRSELGAFSPALKRFSTSANLTLIDSKIELNNTGAVRANRRLAGQAPYVVNLSLRYSDPDTRLSSSLVYNVVGPFITDVGVRLGSIILPEVEQQPIHSLDYIGSWGISKNLKLKFKARNLLLQKPTLKQGPIVAQQLNPGFTISLGLAWEY
ncbi:MAG: TonB-dependent receptor [Deltaproteobacteria bacterium]|nr:TonB-dependent receptor [Deltaproteobacteria bacterium]